MKAFVFLCLCVGILSGCRKDNTVSENDWTTMSVEFDNIVGGQNLFLNTTTYTNSSGEDYTISAFNYFISNISLHKTDGTTYTVPQDSSYFLVIEGSPDSRFARFRVPVGDYDRLNFIIGVDSLRSTMDVSRRTGVLDPTGGHDAMYWGWNSGYIFMKLEGTSPAAPADATGQHKYRYHIGGFGGLNTPTINNIKQVSIDLRNSGIAQPRVNGHTNIHLLTDAGAVFNGPTDISIAANPSVMNSAFSTTVANNYVDIFYHDHTEN